ncbi:ribosomal protein S18-alanine N-acetyltransferase [Chloroflexota bacterium]
MKLSMRPMQPADIKQVKEIDRQAFPTLETSLSFKKELRNEIARYIVAYELDKDDKSPSIQTAKDSVFSRAIFKIRMLALGPPPTKQNIVGFAGVWFMAGEAHLITIAVREVYRGLSVGEYLLAAVIDIAIDAKARFTTLEVRSSNQTAQSLYKKYGFTTTGRRKGYYSDTREDAIIMTTSDINSDDFLSRFKQLKRQLFNKMALF